MLDFVNTFRALNALELVTALATSIVCIWIGWKNFGRLSAWAAALIVLAALFDAANLSQFATTDEYGIAFNVATDGAGFLVQWLQGPLHTTGAVFVPLARVIVEFWPGFASADIGVPVFKALHWAGGVILVAFVALNATKLTESRFRSRNYFFFFVILLLLPPVAVMVKTFNYDAYSLLGAILALLLLVRATLEDSQPLRRYAIIVAALAAQEKLNASPVLLLVLYGSAVLNAYSEQSTRKALITLVVDTATVFAIGAASTLAYIFATKQAVPFGSFVWSTLDPLTVWVYMPLAFLANRPELFGLVSVLVAPLIIASIAAALATTFALARRFPTSIPKAEVFARFAWRLLPWFMVCAAIGAYLVIPQWAPFSPSKIGALANSHPMNGVFLHFGMHTLAQHYFAYFFYAWTVCFIALPSVLWVASACGLWCHSNNPKLDAALGILLWLAYGMVLLAIILHVPIGSRYLCISILIIALASLVRMLELLQQTPRFAARSNYWLGLATALLVLEVAPFGPLYASFRPIWLEYGDLKPEPGLINASWIGWGEEAMQAGKLLEERCQAGDGLLDGVDCRQLRLHAGYFGVWLGKHTIVQDMTINNPQLSTNADYYVLNRSMLVQASTSLWPKVEADFVLTARGYPMAWIYRGDHLAASGWFQRDATTAH
jgi:hypothetical protein